jgi:glycosyltransferase involved in cell wall biosynthesis
MKILLVTTKELTGLNYHRQFVPHSHLQDTYGKEMYEYSKCFSLADLTDNQIQDHDIVSFLRMAENPSLLDPTASILRAKKLGCKTILDIDDYWLLHPKHPQKELYEANGYPAHAVAGLKAVDCVTTTTEHFADKIREYNKNVVVLPNSIDPNQSQFKVQEIPNERVRLGWIGGVFHAEDLKMVHNGFNEVWKTVNHSKFQFCLGGWNHPDKLSYVQHQIKHAPFEPSMLQYFKSIEYQLLLGQDVPNEHIFRKEFSNIPPYDLIEGYMTDFLKFPKEEQYKTFLKSKVADVTKGFDKPYRRLHGQTADKYASMYNNIDVALVPLVENSFNSYKSQIKIIEAGYFKKAVVVSSVNPYLVDCNKSNSIQILPSKRGDGWGSAMKSLIFNENKREDLAEALHEHVMDNYLMDKTNKIRHQLYQNL